MNPASAAVLGALIWVLPGAAADAQQYPARPIRLGVPFAQGGAPASSEQGPAERGAGARLRDATVKLAGSASLSVPAPCASPGSDPKGSPLPPCDAPRLRDANVRESGPAAGIIVQTTGMRERYPSRAIRLVVPFAPGGALDVVGRIVGHKLSEALGQPVVVDNRGGAGGTIGADIVAKAPPDGHTLLVASMGLAVNAVLYPKLPYDTLKDLAPVTMLGEQPNIVVVHPSLPVKSVGELLALTRAEPGQISYGTGGIGSTSHLVTVLFLLAAKIDMLHVPYKGLGPAITALLGGQVQLAVSNVSTALPHVKAGKLRLLAVTTSKRFPLLPEAPTVSEAGVPGAESSGWYGMLVTAGAPEPVVSRLHAETTKILNSAALKEQFGTQGLEPIPTSPETFAKLLRADIEKWGRVIKASGAKPE